MPPLLLSMKPALSYIHDAVLGTVGTAAPILAAIASWQEQVEWGLRIFAICMGCLVSGLTIWSIRATHKSRVKAPAKEEKETPP